eukprot:TRINITY_DN83141_c0_g1_i1.p1 TRINITY_DN83141_c0_g1~~TRINITY_DN83141_c0_g1_i1.p1  ORF type:complete len:514 (+),score=115.61 TRINITY_DN83141_c0_g1_i1:123-1664(+)
MGERNYDRPAFLELFLTPSEKDVFSTWKEVVIDRSVVNKIVDPIFGLLAAYVPESVAPNALTLCGSVAVLQAWYFCEVYHTNQPRLVTFVNTVSLFVFWACGRIDGKHAKRTMNDTSLGELFKYVCDLVSSVFLIVVLCVLLLEEDSDTQWYCVQSVQLVLLLKHYSAFVREAGLRYFLVGPGELLSWASGALVVRMLFGLQWLQALYDLSWGFCCNQFVKHMDLDPTSYMASMHPARAMWLMLFWGTVTRIASTQNTRHSWTRNALLMIMCLRGISGQFRMQLVVNAGTNRRDVIFDGLFMGMVTSDIIVAKMAGRELHWWVVMMATMVVMPHLQFLTLCFVVFYYIAVFGDLTNHMNLPLLQVCRNVYCDGIYDLCHVGHKNLFARALKNGNRLFVGVVGDKDANAYKRPPIMSAAERESEVASCKCVTKVIPNAPCFGLTEEFIKQNQIHVVAFGQEYLERFPNPDDDPYYKVPRKMGIGMPMPRTEGLSTSELISRIQNRPRDEKKSPT